MTGPVYDEDGEEVGWVEDDWEFDYDAPWLNDDNENEHDPGSWEPEFPDPDDYYEKALRY